MSIYIFRWCGGVDGDVDVVDSQTHSVLIVDPLSISILAKISRSPKKHGNSFICPTRSGTTEIYIFGPAGAGIQNKICNIHLIDIVLQVQKYLEVQVFLVLQKYLEYQKQWNCSKLSERDTDMQNNIVKLRQRVRQG